MMYDYSYILKGISSVLNKNNNRIFCSEADFQFALALQLQKCINDFKKDAIVRLEYTPYEFNPDMHIDIVIEDGKHIIPIELKYKTKSLPEALAGKALIRLKNQSAEDCARYDYLKDIERIESLQNSKKYSIPCGIALFLTNDHLFWQRPTKDNVYDTNFRLHEFEMDNKTQHIVKGTLSWASETGPGTMKGRENSITLKGNYNFHWYTDYTPYGQDFRYTLAVVY